MSGREMRCGAYNLAIDAYTYAIEINPADETLYTNRALAFLKLHQYKKASQ
jgi:tetratricopeptide (TPR) repeat protein